VLGSLESFWQSQRTKAKPVPTKHKAKAQKEIKKLGAKSTRL
jgi:hypothetical protein